MNARCCESAVATAMLSITVFGAAAMGQDGPQPPPGETELTLDNMLGGDANEQEAQSWWNSLRDNLRLNFDIVGRATYTTRREEIEGLIAVGLDMRKVFSDAEGDIGTFVFQPYIVRHDNRYDRMIVLDEDDSYEAQFHDAYFNYTRVGKGQTNIKIGHFDVPFGLEPNVDTHFTLHQLISMRNAGAKKDWGISLNGATQDFDYEIAITMGTGMDMTRLDHDPFLFSGRIGTPSDANTVFGFSALYGETIDAMGTHRHDEGGGGGAFMADLEGWLRRWRLGVDATHIVDQWTFRGELSTGEDFKQELYNLLLEAVWTAEDERFNAYLQAVVLVQNGYVGWDEDIHSRLTLQWLCDNGLDFSIQWIHEFERWASITGGGHTPEDTIAAQLRFRY